jgi:ABC-type transport system involved in multi-copper enzyme maturation permease subunit
MVGSALTPGAARRGEFPRLFRMELFKLRRRPMSVILAAVLAALCFGLTLMLYVVFQIADDESSRSVGSDGRQELLDRVIFPGALTGSVEYALAYGVPMLIVLTAASFGGEFAWGTVRLLLARGESRTDFVLSKLAAIVVWWTTALVVATASALGTALLVWLIAGEPGPTAADRAALTGFLGILVRGWFATLVYVALTALLTVQLRSTAWGLATGLVCFFGERVVGGVADSVGIGLLEWLVRLGIGYNVRAVIDNGEGSDNPPLFAAALLTVYVIAAISGATRHLRRHDVVISGAG